MFFIFYRATCNGVERSLRSCHMDVDVDVEVEVDIDLDRMN